jgi:hypothetical protein
MDFRDTSEKNVFTGVMRLVGLGDKNRAKETLDRFQHQVSSVVYETLMAAIQGTTLTKTSAAILPPPTSPKPVHSRPIPPRTTLATSSAVPCIAHATQEQTTPSEPAELAGAPSSHEIEHIRWGNSLLEEQRLSSDTPKDVLLFLNAFESPDLTVSFTTVHRRCEGKDVHVLMKAAKPILKSLGYDIYNSGTSLAVVPITRS